MLHVTSLVKEYQRAGVRALAGVSFAVEQGEVVAITGPSGSGKSTLLHLLGTLDRPTSGQVTIAGEDVRQIRNLPRFRAENLGFVFQFHHLVRTLTLTENVELPLVALHVPRGRRGERSSEVLERVGLADRRSFLPAQVSGGERQRCAIARALINRPRLLLADEPTGHLDQETGATVMSYLLECCASGNTALLLATHNPEVAHCADRIISLRDGLIEADHRL